MFTRKRWTPPTGLSAEGQKIVNSLQAYLLSLETPGSFYVDGTVVAGAYKVTSDTNPTNGLYLPSAGLPTIVGSSGIDFSVGGNGYMSLTANAVNLSKNLSLNNSLTISIENGMGADVQVVTGRQTGYTNAMTGTADRATSYATGTITLVQLAERVKAIQDDLTTHGLIGT